ncbi:MAG TPA: hypothetical protein VFO57_10205 [Burkholderiales bacterium]|nr:hypothetical protein [Burkholderiales bacterium]
MNLLYRQRGFIQFLAQLVVALILLALAARFVWWVATETNFDQVATILWGLGFVAAYFITLGNYFVLRMPAGFGVFALIGLASLPLSWLAASRVALLVLLAAQLAFSFYAGRAISVRLRARHSEMEEDEAARKGAGLVTGLGRWAMLALAALMVLLIGPLLVLALVSVAVDLSDQELRWLAALWGLAGVAWFGYRFGVVKWRRVPACAWIYLLATVPILVADALAGPFAEGAGVQVAYTTMPGALAAAFVEVFVFGGGQLDPDDRLPDS